MAKGEKSLTSKYGLAPESPDILHCETAPFIDYVSFLIFKIAWLLAEKSLFELRYPNVNKASCSLQITSLTLFCIHGSSAVHRPTLGRVAWVVYGSFPDDYCI